MKKIHLDVDALDVQSFATVAPDEGGRGTVRGAETAVSGCGCLQSHLQEDTCVEVCALDTRRASDCLAFPQDTFDQPSCLTCATCAGMPGC